MALFKLNKENLLISELDHYSYRNEGRDNVSPQKLLAKFPELILSIPELEIQESEKLLVVCEFRTASGPIDILIITENADIVLIETKLFKNPESNRTVVAQCIDYLKSLAGVEVNILLNSFFQSKYTKPEHIKELIKDDFFVSALSKNIKSGNFKVVIAGDRIHPNVLNMVESIQSAPHLAFTIYTIEIKPYILDEQNIILHPIIRSLTNEVERSVIRLEIDYENKRTKIESGIPEKESKGSKPIITADQFLENLSVPKFSNVIRNFWKEWKGLGGDIRFGVTGFSAGIKISGSRIPIQMLYNEQLYLVMPRTVEKYNINDKIYDEYKNELSHTVPKAYDLLIGNKSMIYYKNISEQDLINILSATIHMVKKLLKNQ